MARRFSSIRSRIIVLVLVPLVALASLWVFVTSITYGDAHLLLQSREFQRKSLLPTQRLIDGLQKERRLSVAELGGARTADRGAIRAQREATDAAREEVVRGSRDGGLRGAIQPQVVRRIDALVTRLGSLAAIRRGVDDRVIDRARALGDYSALIDAGFAVYNATTPGNGAITADARTLTSVGRAREFLAREDALLTGALVAGRVTAAERGEFAQLVGAQRMLYADTTPNLPAADQARYDAIANSPETTRLRLMEDQVIRGSEAAPRTSRASRPGGAAPAAAARGQGARAGKGVQAARAPLPVDPAVWRSVADTANGRLYGFENRFLDDVTGRAQGIAVGVVTRLALAGGLGLLAVVLSTYIAVRVARRLLRECRTLAGGVVDFTRQRLPLLAEQVRAGEPAEPEPVPDVEYRIREIRQIAESFDRAREAVLLAAAGEVAARRGISEVFVNLARRNQALLHRQLALLDTMERRTEDPAELSDLFRLDHLATRMRRHAEGLVILAGKTAGRGWRRPVPLVDVVRGAVAEVEDYPRVRVQPLPRIALLGAAVADVIHLLAEVVENATTFSPPQSPVRVSGHPVAHGFAIEVEDRGLGMTDEALRAANARLAEPPEFDPSDSAQLGLFVVGRLAQRHDIKVTLRQSPYGGTTAIALIPGPLIVEGAEQEPVARRPTGPMPSVPAAAAPALSASARPAARQDGVVRLVAEAAPAERTGGGRKRPEQARPEPAKAPPEPASPEPASPQGDGELPKRRRQTHLAPQLKERVDAHLAAQDGPPEPKPRPDPGGMMPLSAPVPADALPADVLPVQAPPAQAPPADVPLAEDPLARPPVADAASGAGAGGTGAAGTAPQDRPEAGDARSPEALRSKMSAMQRGWQRGRHEAAGAEAGQNDGDQEDDTP
ncbi:sensor histidine kinase [Actinomadura graeca]|uniref:histidine kinase n=1 Tax=Actinomadura graeca TaxID=2750812 RepID=A0ABX8R3Y3_9ACTN|nr:nitrate- and nitrite sensing domain-containing protein [Actinomadura graeca]QXJ24682.1 sensor histidine kinase [Actinomadura graeca]